MENYIDLREAEFKYFSSDISLTKFQELMNKLKPSKFIEVSSWDVYYEKTKDDFIRYRKGDKNSELTIKRKRSIGNNFDRTEINLQLGDNIDFVVKSFVDLLGYKENFKIFKSCWIYYFDNVDIVYYITYDPDLKELDRFIEIEYLDNNVCQGCEKIDPFKILKEYEQKISELGITHQNRIKRSLYEQYRIDKSE